MNIERVLAYLDAATEATERLVGADYLEERDYIQEAAFYRWLIQENKVPFECRLNQHLNYYYWCNSLPLANYDLYDRCAISSPSIWSLLVNNYQYDRYNDLVYHWLRFPQRAVAVAALRQAYLGVINEPGNSNSTAG